jgi:hypothetical protein
LCALTGEKEGFFRATFDRDRDFYSLLSSSLRRRKSAIRKRTTTTRLFVRIHLQHYPQQQQHRMETEEKFNRREKKERETSLENKKRST